MLELSLHILDVLENAVEAGATRVNLRIEEDLQVDRLTIDVAWDGCPALGNYEGLGNGNYDVYPPYLINGVVACTAQDPDGDEPHALRIRDNQASGIGPLETLEGLPLLADNVGFTLDTTTGIVIPDDATADTTDAAGAWSIADTRPPCNDDCTVTTYDLDGPANGSYPSRQVPLDLARTEPGDGRWYQGRFEQHDVEIELDAEPDRGP